MFQVKSLGGFDFSVKYQIYFQSLPKSVIINAESKENAFYQFLDFGFTFLKVQIEGLTKTIELIKPHFYNVNANPYLGNYQQWFGYHRMVIDLLEELEELEMQPLKYIELINSKINFVKNLNPLDKRVYTKDFGRIVQSIQQTSSLLQRKIESQKQLANAS